MRNLLAIGLLVVASSLAGCATAPQVVTTQRQIVIQVPEGLWSCPVTKLPGFEKLTDAQVASLIKKMYQNNQTCQQSIAAVKKYLASARATVE